MSSDVEAKTGSSLTDRIIIRYLRRDEIEKAESLVRLAFGTFLQISDPLLNPGKKQNIFHRFQDKPRNIFDAELDGDLIATNVLTKWGSFAFFGPLAVRPEHWDAGVGTKLVESAVGIFEKEGVKHQGLFTFADSPKHLGLSQIRFLL